MREIVSNGFLSDLRNSTSVLHKQLGSAPVSAALLSENVNIVDYALYLLKMKDVIAFCEKKVFPIAAVAITDIHKRKKMHLIKRDLEYLQIDSEIDNDSYEPLKDLNLAFALGYMYVIEGSTLGGRIILKHVSNKLNVTEDIGGSYFGGYRSDTSAFWKAFLNLLLDYTLVSDDASEIIEGAKHAFQSIYVHFNNKPC